MGSGVAITTGLLKEVPALTTYLLADIKFEDLSTASVSLVSEGKVYLSTLTIWIGTHRESATGQTSGEFSLAQMIDIKNRRQEN